MFNFRVSRDGRFVLAASSLTDSTGVWLVDSRSTARRNLPQTALRRCGHPMVLASRLVWRGTRPVCRPQRRGGHAERVVSGEAVKVLNDWSSTAEVIIYTQHDAKTKLDLWQLPVSGGAARPLLKTGYNEAQARISPNGRWIAYVSDSSGTQEVYVQRYPELSPPLRVSTGGGAQPQWRGDQRELFFLAPDRSLMAVTVTDADSSGAPRQLFRTTITDDPSGARDSYTAMPDGHSFLIDARRDDTTTSITVLLDWAAGLAAPPVTPSDNRDASELGRRTRAP